MRIGAVLVIVHAVACGGGINSPAVNQPTAARQLAPAASDAKDARGRPRGFICGYLASPDITWSLDEDDLKALEESKETGDGSKPVDHGD